eukprot:6174894-Pleurochrysis_carterae.AAC.2
MAFTAQVEGIKKAARLLIVGNGVSQASSEAPIARGKDNTSLHSTSTGAKQCAMQRPAVRLWNISLY